MVWPILISVSVTPGPLFFCANVLLVIRQSPISTLNADVRVLNGLGFMVTPPVWIARCIPDACRAAASICRVSVSFLLLHPVNRGADKSGNAGRHQIHEPDDDHAEDRLRRCFGNLVGKIGNELDKNGTEYGTG